MLAWQKRGLIFDPRGLSIYGFSRVLGPTPDLRGDRVRIYFASRNNRKRSSIFYIETDAESPEKGPLSAFCDQPVLPLGEPGAFDEHGTLIGGIVDCSSRKYLFYTGYLLKGERYQMAIGLAVSEDDGRTFTKVSPSPVLRATDADVDSVLMSAVLIESGRWRMWYTSCTNWRLTEGRWTPFYDIKYAESGDGIDWRSTGIVCIAACNEDEAIGHPCVWKDDRCYKMLYSYRTGSAFRTDRSVSYRIGYAESIDGLTWERKDEESGISPSESGWDSQMIEYASIYAYGGRKYLLYNGNDFGASGLGYAVMERDADKR